MLRSEKNLEVRFKKKIIGINKLYKKSLNRPTHDPIMKLNINSFFLNKILNKIRN